MHTRSPFPRHLLSTAELVLALSIPSIASAYDVARAAAVSDPENAAAYSVAAEPSGLVVPQSVESAGARAAATSDPENAAAHDGADLAVVPERADSATQTARSAVVSDPENVASHS